MKIQIGSIISSFCGRKSSSIALNIPGIGVIEAKEDEEDKPFCCVILNKKQLKKLRSTIDQIIKDE